MTTHARVAPSKLVEEVLQIGFHPALQSAGYARQGRTFYRGDDPIRVVNIQSSKWNTVDKAEITINLGVFFPTVPLISLPPPKGKPRECECTLRTRIGSLIPPHLDKWWTITRPRTLLP